MKKLLLPTALMLALVAFSSCKKEYTCICTQTSEIVYDPAVWDPAIFGNQDQSGSITSTFTIKDTEKNAESSCEDNGEPLQTIPGGTGVTNTLETTCALE